MWAEVKKKEAFHQKKGFFLILPMFVKHSTRRLQCFRTEAWNKESVLNVWDNNESMFTAATVLAVVCEDVWARSEDAAVLSQTCCRFAQSFELPSSPASHVSPAFCPPTCHTEENILHPRFWSHWDDPVSLYNNVSCLNCQCCDRCGGKVCVRLEVEGPLIFVCVWFI